MDLLTHYFKTNPHFVSKHHLDSFNDFVEVMIPKVIASMNPIVVNKNEKGTNKLKHSFEAVVGPEVYFDRPRIKGRIMFPNEARLNDATYSVNVLCDITFNYFDKNDKKIGSHTVRKVKIGAIPIMLHSKLCILNGQSENVLREMGECPYDQGGYFIIDGKEKVIIAQERNVTNHLFVEETKDDDSLAFKAFIRCTAEKTSVFPKTIIFNVFNGRYLKGERKNAITVTVPHIKSPVPLFILFRALGVESDKDILRAIIPDEQFHDSVSEENELMLDFLRSNIIDSNIIFTQHQAVEYLKHFTTYGTVEHVMYILYQNLFPNIESNDDELSGTGLLSKKAIYLGYLVNHLVKVCLGIKAQTDRDNYMFKRVGISGFLIGDIFKDFYNKFRVRLRNNMDKMYEAGRWVEKENLDASLITIENIRKLVYPDIIEKGLVRSLKGQWGLEKSKDGIVQDLSRVSYLSFISHMRRVQSPMDPSIKIRSPHTLNTSQYGFMCPVESPDGASIGLIKNFSLLCHVTFHVPSSSVMDALRVFNIKTLDTMTQGMPIGDVTCITLNNTWVGTIETKIAHILVEYIKLLRRNALINIFTSVSWNIAASNINILTESGRCCRPLLIVGEDGLLTLKKKHIDLNATESWYNHLKGDLLKDDDYNPYSTSFIDPFALLAELGLVKNKNPSLQEIMEVLKKTAAPIEFVDVEECNTCLIAMYPSDVDIPKNDRLAHYTHCELHPSTMFSVLTASIPLANHNHAPRNIFACAQNKQAVGVYATNANNRIDTMAYMLHYPQQRLVKTKYTSLLHLDDMPNGENLIVAICTYTGYNQEDSVILNKDAVDRGMFNITYYKSYISEEVVQSDNQLATPRIVFANPLDLAKSGYNIKSLKEACYEKIDDRGLPKLNEYIQEGDAVVGKVKVVEEKPSNDFEDNEFVYETCYSMCEIADKTIAGHVDKVYAFDKPSTSQTTIKVRLRKMRLPELGDKVASSHSQKGVVGLILPSHMMPFTTSGIVPDIIINPHAFPTRMTVGHLLECVLSKVCVLDGAFVDATPFDKNNLETFYNRLEDHGFERSGNEVLYNGVTGTQMASDVFFGPTYYHRLKHMVADKINTRTRGKKMSVTMQPTKGRSNEGGLRIGEMETNCLISYGIASFTKESLMERSDGHSFKVDNSNGDLIATDDGIMDISRVKMPFSFKLLCQELNAMNLMPRLLTDRSLDLEARQNENDIDEDDEIDEDDRSLSEISADEE